MRSISFPQWGGQTSATTDASDCSYYGVAIGPRSDEGLVLVGGEPLQAGLVLPLRAKSYSVAQARGPDLTGNLAAIQSLELVLVESLDELGGSFSRPNAIYSAPKFSTPNSIPDAPQLAVPFVGRAQCLFQIVPAVADAFSYAIVGCRWSVAAGAVWQSLIHQGNDVVADSFGSYGFYVGGGGDQREVWDVLQLFVWSDLGIQVTAEAVAIGELV
jgi:hypothetical protein